MPHAALPTPGLARKCCWVWLQGSPSLANLPRPGFNPLLSQGFGLLVYADTILFILMGFFLSSSPSCGRSIIRLSQGQPCYMDQTQVNFTPLPLTAPSPCLQEGLLAAAFVTEPADRQVRAGGVILSTVTGNAGGPAQGLQGLSPSSQACSFPPLRSLSPERAQCCSVGLHTRQ